MKKEPNSLLILIDQAAWKALPAYGNRHVCTPNIDRIFDQGVAFSQAYTPCPLCQPARGAFWTGLFPHQTGNLSNGRLDPVPLLPDSIPTLGEFFSRAGYLTIHFGKQHDAGSLRGFELEPLKTLPVDRPPALPLNDDTFQDRYTTEKTVEFLSGATHIPFFAIADLNNPHNICGWVGENQGAHIDLPPPPN
jgi:choline-sulfatase